jgi:hypothetical protein
MKRTRTGLHLSLRGHTVSVEVLAKSRRPGGPGFSPASNGDRRRRGCRIKTIWDVWGSTQSLGGDWDPWARIGPNRSSWRLGIMPFGLKGGERKWMKRERGKWDGEERNGGDRRE